jgi:hypothetical protein
MSYAQELPTLTFYNAIKNAKRLTGITPFSFSESRWRDFAQVPDFPNGLLPIGDAICRFNPAYGQGMTVALQEANLLFDLLRTLDGSQLSTLAPTFLTKAETLIAPPWAMSAIPAFIYPETTGERPADLEDRLNFQRALGRLAVRDLEILEITASSSKDFLTLLNTKIQNLSLSRYKNATLQNVHSSLRQSFPVLSSPLLPRDQGVLSYVPGGNRTHI